LAGFFVLSSNLPALEGFFILSSNYHSSAVFLSYPEIILLLRAFFIVSPEFFPTRLVTILLFAYIVLT